MSSKQITVNQSGHFVPQKEMPSLVYFPCVLVSLSFSYHHHSPKAAMLTPHRRFRVFSFVSGLRSEYPRKREITVFLTPPHLMCEAIIGWTVDQSYCVSSVINSSRSRWLSEAVLTSWGTVESSGMCYWNPLRGWVDFSSRCSPLSRRVAAQ